jgi:hypothetical protein
MMMYCPGCCINVPPYLSIFDDICVVLFDVDVDVVSRYRSDSFFFPFGIKREVLEEENGLCKNESHSYLDGFCSFFGGLMLS